MLILELENIGMIKKTKINLNDITIIAGENNIGKSTVNKVLYCIIKSLDNKKDYQAADIMLKNIMYDIMDENIVKNIDFKTLFDDKIDKKVGIDMRTLRLLKQKRSLIFEIVSKKAVSTRFTALINSMFNNTLLKFEEEYGIIRLKNEKRETLFDAVVEKDMITIKSLDSRRIPFDDVTLIESTEILNYAHLLNITNSSASDKYIPSQSVPDSNKDLINKLMLVNKNKSKKLSIKDVLQEINSKQFLELEEDFIEVVKKENPIFSSLNDNFQKSAEQGLSFDSETGVCTYLESGRVIPINRIGTGKKIFAIIDKLKENKFLDRRNLLLLDEPEEGLHPKWQVELAEKIGKSNNFKNIKIVITTHSPYFLQGLRYYMEECKITYYNTTNRNKNTRIRNVDKNVNIITENLMSPLKDIRGINGRFTYEV